MNTVEGTITFTLAEWEEIRAREDALKMKVMELEDGLADADAINGAAVNREMELEKSIAALSNRVDVLQSRVRKALTALTPVDTEVKS
jgi:phage shock protein A